MFAYNEQEHIPNPVFLANYHPDSAVNEKKVCKCHDSSFKEVKWPLKPSDIDDAVLGRLMFPFSDLV